jgi:putative oxygen-independent coproporphyrinogen III oxidase
VVTLPRGEIAPKDGSLPYVGDASTPFGVYLHIPFCTARCGYCDYNTYTATELRGVTRQSFVDDLLGEIAFAERVLIDGGHPIRPAATVFIGGGTPTLLPITDIDRILDAVRQTFGIVPGAQITIEANPDSVSESGMHELAAAGVTRVSVGMQSAVPAVLATLDRTHNPQSVVTAVEWAKAAGLRTSVDLIYGTPGESLDDWRLSVEAALALDTDHVSAYALIIEDGTALERRIRRGELDPIDDDLHADMYELADDLFTAAGYDWYEVSNWAKDPTMRSLHNLSYWQGTDWWGFGPGAHSHLNGVRWWNVKHPAAYAERIAAGDSPALEREILDDEQRIYESVLLGIRVREGIAIDSLGPLGRDSVAGLIADELIDGTRALAGRVVLTRRGRLLADLVLRTLLAD